MRTPMSLIAGLAGSRWAGAKSSLTPPPTMNDSQALLSSVPPARRLALIGTFLAVALVASLTVLPPPPPAEAQTLLTSVGNLAPNRVGQFDVGRRDSTGENNAIAVTFTTGGSRSYRLTSISLDISNRGQGQLVVQIRPVNANSLPGAQIGGDLTGTIGASGGLTTYTANGITLDGNTSYFLAIGPAPRPAGTPAATRLRLNVSATLSNAEDSGSTSGWSIANDAYTSPNIGSGVDGTQWDSSGGYLPQFKVNAVDLDAIDGDSEYGWCLGRLSEADCAEAIGRWEGEQHRVPVVTGVARIPRPGGGTTTIQTNHCPRTHLIRTATTNGVVCQQSYHPIGPFSPPIVIPESPEPDDTWDGSPRGCSNNGHPYYNLPSNRGHGLGRGCHKHGSSGPHEHTHRSH